MKKFISIALSFALASILLTGCGETTEEEPTENAAATNVTVAEVQKRDISSTASYTGELTAKDRASVTSKVSAKVMSVSADIGDKVSKGAVLVVLDASDYEYQLKQAQASYSQAQAALKQAQAGLNSAQAGLNSAQVSYNNVKNGSSAQAQAQLEQVLSQAKIAYNDAKTNYDRQKQLYDMGAISLVTFESAQTALENATLALETAQKNYDLNKEVLTPGNEEAAKKGVETAEASVANAKAAVESAQAACNAASLSAEQARTNIANTKITAPISGYISAKNVSVGQFASPGVEMFSVSDTSSLEAQIQVTESVVPYLSMGGEAEISIDASGIKDLKGEITVINPVKNAQTGMYTVRVSVPNSDDKLKVGMFADVVLLTDRSAKNVSAVPAKAVLQENEGYYVYVAKGTEAEKREVVTGVSDGEYTEIQSGLTEGEKVVVDGKEYLSETNRAINIVE